MGLYEQGPRQVVCAHDKHPVAKLAILVIIATGHLIAPIEEYAVVGVGNIEVLALECDA